MEASAPDLEWLRAQNSYHAPGVCQAAANLIIPAGARWGWELQPTAWQSDEKEAGTRLLRGKSRGCHRRPGMTRARMPPPARPSRAQVPGDDFN